MIKAWKHLCTILHHKNLVRAGCFKIGLYKQGLLHDMSKYTPTEFLVRITQNVKIKGILRHGFTIKDEINIIWSTGLIMESVMEEMDKKHIAGSVA